MKNAHTNALSALREAEAENQAMRKALTLIESWWTGGGAALHADALIGDDDRTIAQVVCDALKDGAS